MPTRKIRLKPSRSSGDTAQKGMENNRVTHRSSQAPLFSLLLFHRLEVTVDEKT
jgi:hypothetical protein